MFEHKIPKDYSETLAHAATDSCLVSQKLHADSPETNLRAQGTWNMCRFVLLMRLLTAQFPALCGVKMNVPFV
jgi:hypothetical protein